MNRAVGGGARAVVLLSGGLDSGTALAMWCAEGGAVASCLFADYGQRAVDREAAASAALAARFGAGLRRLDLGWLGDAASLAGSALVERGGSLPERTADDPGDAASAAAVWVPARNVVLVAAAAAWAEALGAGFVVAGFNREEAATFADNTAEFGLACDAVLAKGTRRGVRVVSPTWSLDKIGIVGAARRAGLRADDFWSCYAGGASPCGRCESCVRSARAWGA